MKKRRNNLPRPRCNGQWTESRYRSFITSALRRAQWPVKYAAIKKAYVKDGINPKTGRKCKLHRCEHCKKLFHQKDIAADHINPVVDVMVGFVDWDTYINRLFCEIKGFQALCYECHSIKTQKEREIAKERKNNEQS